MMSEQEREILVRGLDVDIDPMMKAAGDPEVAVPTDESTHQQKWKRMKTADAFILERSSLRLCTIT